MKSKLKKSLSLLLALVMCLGCMSMSAFAAEVTLQEETENTDQAYINAGAVAKATPTDGATTYYTRLEEAIDAAYNGGTVDLLVDLTDDKAISNWHTNIWTLATEVPENYSSWDAYGSGVSDGYGGKIARNGRGPNNLTINGNNHTLTVNSHDGYNNALYKLFANATNLTVRDLTINTKNNVYGIELNSGVIENVTFNTTHEAIYTEKSENGGHVEIRNCTFNTYTSYPIYSQDAGLAKGTIISNNTFNTGRAVTVRGDMKFVNNVVNCKDGITVADNATTAVVQGNYFAAKDASGNDVKRSIKIYPAPQAVIEGNVILGPIQLATDKLAGGDWEYPYTDAPKLSGNYWGGEAPEGLPTEPVTPTYSSYYTTYTAHTPTEEDGSLFKLSNPENVGGETYVAQIGDTSYDTVEAAVADVTDSAPITVNEETTIGGETVAAGSTVAAVTGAAVNSTDNAATVTPKTLTITKNDEETKTVKAYVVSSGDNEKKAVVTNVAKDDTFTNETSSTSVESYVNVAQVLANAVAANDSIVVSSISSMELSLKKTKENTLPAAVTTAMAQASQTNNVAFEVYPIATVKTTVGTTTTETTYNVSNEELAANASFTFKLTGLTAGKSYTLYHYSGEGELKGTFYKTADANGEVTLTLSSFSYIVGEEIANPETINAVYMSNLSLKESLNLNFYIKLADGVDKSNAVAKVTFNGITTEHPLSDASTVTLYGNTTYKVSQTVVARMMFKTAVLELYVNGEKVPLAKYTGETTAEYVGTAYTDSVDAFLTRYASQYANDSLAVDLANATRAYGTAARAKLTDN